VMFDAIITTMQEVTPTDLILFENSDLLVLLYPEID
jgi:hypothetical protein